MTAPIEPRRYRPCEALEDETPEIVEAVLMDHANYRSVCDWINGESMAWKRGYNGRAYPDLCGMAIPTGPDSHEYVRWGHIVAKGVEGFRGWEPYMFKFAYEEVS